MANHQVRPQRLRLEKLGLEPYLAKLAGEDLGARALVAGWVGRIDAEQGLADPLGIVRQASRGHRATVHVRYVVSVHSVTAFVPRTREQCWQVFVDATKLPLWVPGLRRAQVLAMERGLPSEIHFEFASSRVYTLVYSYDLDKREVRWQPKLGKRDGVTGSVTFGPVEGGTEVTYALEHGEGRSPSERELGDTQKLVEAFVGWMQEERSS